MRVELPEPGARPGQAAPPAQEAIAVVADKAGLVGRRASVAHKEQPACWENTVMFVASEAAAAT